MFFLCSHSETKQMVHAGFQQNSKLLTEMYAHVESLNYLEEASFFEQKN